MFEAAGYGKILCRAALMCVAADSPASRKVGGFLGHQALHGCTKCLKEFKRQGFNDRPNYGGFQTQLWKKRTNEDHRRLLTGLDWPAQKLNAVRSSKNLVLVIRNSTV